MVFMLVLIGPDNVSTLSKCFVSIELSRIRPVLAADLQNSSLLMIEYYTGWGPLAFAQYNVWCGNFLG
jgi:hypothetical protein